MTKDKKEKNPKKVESKEEELRDDEYDLNFDKLSKRDMI
jgi:hypothetical protein